MRTQVMQEFAIGTPWLEHEPSGGAIEKTLLHKFPFTIGRNDSSELRIDSNQVSREHAVITRHGKKYRVRDLGSTNGTFLNGEQIEEATLGDGDLLVIAEVSFTFYCQGGAGSQTATQVIQPAAAHWSSEGTIWDTVLAVRRTHEIVSQRSLRTLFQPIVELESGEAFAYEAFAVTGADDAPSSRCEQLASATECRATDRMRQLFRRVAIEDAASLPPADRLFLAVAASELASPALVDHLSQLRALLGTTRQLVVEIPDAAVRSTADFRTLLGALRDAEVLVAYDGYASGQALISERKDIPPDYLKLAPSLFRSVHRGKDRQRQVQLIVRASRDVGCDVIATGIDDEADLKICRELGCNLVQGDLFGNPQFPSALIHASRFPAQMH